MPIHPIAAVDRVIEEYEHHVAIELRARDERLRDELDVHLRVIPDGLLGS